MRRIPGSIEISTEDLSILYTVFSAEFISASQLYRLCVLDCPMMSKNTFKWRVRRLADPSHSLLAKHTSAYTNGDPIITITHAGGYLLADRTNKVLPEDFSYISTFDQKSFIKAQHALTVNELHLCFRIMPEFREWLPAWQIKLQNSLNVNRFSKDYDAVVRLERARAKTVSVAIELERSSKSQKAYKQIASELSKPDKVEHVLYIVNTETLQKFVARSLRGCARTILTTLHDQFLDQALDAPALCTGPTWQEGTISSFLFG